MTNSQCKIQTNEKNSEFFLLEDNENHGNQPENLSRKIHSILDIDTTFEGYGQINNSLNNVLDLDIVYRDPTSISDSKSLDDLRFMNRKVLSVASMDKLGSCLDLYSTGSGINNSHEFSSHTPSDEKFLILEDTNYNLTIPLAIALKNGNWQLVFILLARIRIFSKEEKYRQSLREIFFFVCLPESSHLALLLLHIPQLDIIQPFQSFTLFQEYLIPLLSDVVSHTYPLPNELPYTHICCIAQQRHLLESILELKLGRVDDLDSNQHTPLHAACLSSSLICAQLLIKYGANVNAQSTLPYSSTPLYCAVFSNSSSKLINLLLQASANLEAAESGYGKTLHLAVALENASTIEILIKEGSEIDSQVHVDWESVTSLIIRHRQCNMSRHRVMLKMASLNQLGTRLSTPLMMACALGNLQIVELLLNSNADIHIQDCHQETAIFYAAGEWYNDIVDKLIIHGADVNSKNYLNDTPVLQALKSNRHKSGVKFSCKISTGKQPIDTIEALAKNNADLNYENTQGDSFISLFLRLWPGCNNLLEIAANYDLNLDVPDEDGKTLLLHACEQGWGSSVQVLLTNDANLEVLDRNGNTPLLLACQNGYNELVKFLLQVGADPFQANINGVTPLLILVKRGEANILDLIISPGYITCEPLRNINSKSGQPLPWVVAAKAGDDNVLSKLIKHLLWEDSIPFKEMFKKGLRESIHYWLLHPIYFVSCNPVENAVTIKFSEMQKKYVKNKSLYNLITDNNKGLDLGSHPVVHAYVNSVFKFFATKYLLVRTFLSILFLIALGFSFVFEATTRDRTRASQHVESLPAEIFVFFYWLSNIVSELLEFNYILATCKTPNSYYWRKPLYTIGLIKEDYRNVVEAYKARTKRVKGRFKKVTNRRHFIICAFINYFRDVYNWIELVANISLLMYFCIRVFLFIHPNHHFADYFYYLRLIVFLFNCSSFIKFIIIFSLFGEYLHIIFVIFRDDVPKFLVIFTATALIFSVTFILTLRLPIKIDSNNTGNSTYESGVTINLFDLKDLNGITDNFGYLLLFCIRNFIEGDKMDFNYYDNRFNFAAVILTFGFLFITLIVYINLFVAQLLDTYQSVKANAKSIAAKNRMCFIDQNQRRSIFSAYFRPRNEYITLEGDKITKFFNLESALDVQQIQFPEENQEITEVIEPPQTQPRPEMGATSYSKKTESEPDPQIEEIKQKLISITEKLERFAGVEEKLDQLINKLAI